MTWIVKVPRVYGVSPCAWSKCSLVWLVVVLGFISLLLVSIVRLEDLLFRAQALSYRMVYLEAVSFVKKV